MPFQNGHRIAKRLESEPLDRNPVSLRVRQGTAEKLKRIPNWQGRLRDYIELLVMREQRQMKRIEDDEV